MPSGDCHHAAGSMSYWHHRYADAVLSADLASSTATREVYLDLAQHYRSLIQFLCSAKVP